MIFLLDENLSPTIAGELNRLGYRAQSFRDLGWLGMPDEVWLPRAGQMPDTLVLTCDLRIFTKGRQRPGIVSGSIGIVFLTGADEPTESKMRLITSSLAELEELHNNTPRPFAWFLYPDGRLLDNLEGERL